MKSEHEIYWPTRGIKPHSSDRPSLSVRIVSQPTEPPRQVMPVPNSKGNAFCRGGEKYWDNGKILIFD